MDEQGGELTMARKTLSSQNNPSWNFEQKKELHGKLVDKRENIGPNNSKLFTIENKDGKFSVWGSAVLDKLDQLKVGTEVWIEYLGKEKGKKGTMFKNYKIDFDDADVPVSDSQEIADILDGK